MQRDGWKVEHVRERSRWANEKCLWQSWISAKDYPIWETNQVFLVYPLSGHRWRGFAMDISHPLLIKLPHRSYWGTIDRPDPREDLATMVKEDDAKYFDNRDNVIGLYIDNQERDLCERSDAFALPEHAVVYDSRVNWLGLPRTGRR